MNVTGLVVVFTIVLASSVLFLQSYISRSRENFIKCRDFSLFFGYGILNGMAKLHHPKNLSGILSKCFPRSLSRVTKLAISAEPNLLARLDTEEIHGHFTSDIQEYYDTETEGSYRQVLSQEGAIHVELGEYGFQGQAHRVREMLNQLIADRKITNDDSSPIRVMELGCGNGYNSLLLAKWFPQVRDVSAIIIIVKYSFSFNHLRWFFLPLT
jgi:hypothetical protein